MDIAYLGDAPGKVDSEIEKEVEVDFTGDRIESRDGQDSQHPDRVKARI